jgi:superfamily II DNA or RNA helicase
MDYSYQIPAAKKVYEMANSSYYQAAVLAAAPNAGKSSIIVHILNMYIKDFPSYKIVLLTHNQNLLKEQMLEGFTNGFVKPDFTFGELGSNSQVEVGIPASRSKINSMDVLVVDEAHQFYGCSMVSEIIAKFKPKHQILMTGSPSIYNGINKKSPKPVYGIYYISGEELAEAEVYSEVVIDVVKVWGHSVLDDYNTAYKKLCTDYRFNPSKIMIACKTIKDAEYLGSYLNNNGRKVAISVSSNDSKNEQLNRFKNGEADTLIVVNKGILGFSDNMVTALIDLKSSKDLDSRNQLFARILRKHPDGVKKFYISTAKKANFNKEVQILYSVADLMKKKAFQTYIK